MSIIIREAANAFNGIFFLFCVSVIGVVDIVRVAVMVKNGLGKILKLWPSMIVVEGVLSHSPIGLGVVGLMLVALMCDLYWMIA